MSSRKRRVEDAVNNDDDDDNPYETNIKCARNDDVRGGDDDDGDGVSLAVRQETDFFFVCCRCLCAS